MTNCLFYNSKTGDGAVGDLTRDAFKTTRSFGSGAFATNWSHIEQTTRGILFYNEKDGSAAIGSLSEGDFKTTDVFPKGFFAPGWTHIYNMDESMFFYRASTGEAAIVVGFSSAVGSIKTVKVFPSGSFAKGWTHIIHSTTDSSLLLFYNSATGEGAIAERLGIDNIKTLKIFKAGDFSVGWSQIVTVNNGKILFYNQGTGEGALGSLTREDFKTERTWPAGAFAIGWTNIISTGDSVLFYNAVNGSAAIGFEPTLKTFSAGAFLTGWTDIAISKSRSLPPVRNSIFLESGDIRFDGGVPVQGWSKVAIFSDGRFSFSGHFHNSGAVSFGVSVILWIRSNSGTAFTFSNSGHMAGTFTPGSRDWDFATNGTNDSIRAAWEDLSAGFTGESHAQSGIDIIDLWKNIKVAVKEVSEIVAVVGPLVS